MAPTRYLRCCSLRWSIFGLPDLAIGEIIHRAEPNLNARAFFELATGVLLAPLAIAATLLFAEALLEDSRGVLDAFLIAWRRGVLRNVRRAWLYGSVLLLCGVVLIILVGSGFGVLGWLFHIRLPALSAGIALAEALLTVFNLAFAIEYAEALRDVYAGADLEAALDQPSLVSASPMLTAPGVTTSQ